MNRKMFIASKWLSYTGICEIKPQVSVELNRMQVWTSLPRDDQLTVHGFQ